MTSAKKTYGKTSRGIPITDALIEKLASVGEAGYDVEETLQRRSDPMVCALASAPLDDEPTAADEDVAAVEALAAYRHGEGIGSDQMRAELGPGVEGDLRDREDDS